MHILFVCTGNTCRSAMAEGIFKAMAENDPDMSGRFTAESAGLGADACEPASGNAVDVLEREWGIDISSHKARPLTEDMVSKADLILAMTRRHKHMIVSMFPEHENKVYTLKEYVSEKNHTGDMEEYDFTLDITDPYGASRQAYGRCAREIGNALERLVLKLKKL